MTTPAAPLEFERHGRRIASLMAAFLRRDFKTAISYRFGFGTNLAQSVVSVFFLYFLGRLVGTRALTMGGTLRHGYFPFAVLGVALLGVVTSELGAVSSQIRNDQTTGTLEALLSMPPPAWLTMMGSVVYSVLFAAALSLLTVTIAVAGFGMRFDATVPSVVLALAGLIVSLVLFAALGVGFASVVIIFKRGGQLAGLVGTTFSLFGGVYYPVNLLPTPLRLIGRALPFTWSADILRHGLLEGGLAWGSLALLVAATAALAPISLWVFTKAVARSRRTGTLGQY